MTFRRRLAYYRCIHTDPHLRRERFECPTLRFGGSCFDALGRGAYGFRGSALYSNYKTYLVLWGSYEFGNNNEFFAADASSGRYRSDGYNVDARVGHVFVLFNTIAATAPSRMPVKAPPRAADEGYGIGLDLSKVPNEFGVGSQDYAPRPYDPDRIDRTLPLGHAQEWSLKSQVFSHPFHIHVNPFQIVAIVDPDGKDVSAPDAVDDYTGARDTNYPGLKGVWKDTIWVKSVRRADGSFIPYTVIFRTRYQRYIGEYVLHCHILDHEDQGMMQNVAVMLSNAVTNPQVQGTQSMNRRRPDLFPYDTLLRGRYPMNSARVAPGE